MARPHERSASARHGADMVRPHERSARHDNADIVSSTRADVYNDMANRASEFGSRVADEAHKIKRGMAASGLNGPRAQEAAEAEIEAERIANAAPTEETLEKTVPTEGFLTTAYRISSEYVRNHPWAVGLGAVATGAALLAAYAYWKKKKGQSNAVVEEMCVLYPLLNKYTKSLNESYTFENYNSYVNASKRMNKIAPYVYSMMLREDDYGYTWNSKTGLGYDKVGGDPMPVPQEYSGIQNKGVPGAGHTAQYDYPNTPSDADIPDPARMPGYDQASDMDTAYGYGPVNTPSDADIPDPARMPGYDQASDMDTSSEDTRNWVIKALDYARETGDAAMKAFLNGFNVSMEWVKSHPGVAGAGALIAILGAYGTYKLIQMYKEKKETGEVDAEKIAESLDMLTKVRAVCESSCNPYITETQKYKNITLICNLIDSDL